MAALPREIAMSILDDLRLAMENFTKNALPNFPCRVVLEGGPRPRVVIEYLGEVEDAEKVGAMGYPGFVKLGGVLRATNQYRRLVGLPDREE